MYARYATKGRCDASGTCLNHRSSFTYTLRVDMSHNDKFCGLLKRARNTDAGVNVTTLSADDGESTNVNTFQPSSWVTSGPHTSRNIDVVHALSGCAHKYTYIFSCSREFMCPNTGMIVQSVKCSSFI